MSKDTITVAGVTFSAEQVVTAVVKIGGRKVEIYAKEDDRVVGFVDAVSSSHVDPEELEEF